MKGRFISSTNTTDDPSPHPLSQILSGNVDVLEEIWGDLFNPIPHWVEDCLVLFVDSRGTIFYINEEVERTLGFSGIEMLGLSLASFCSLGNGGKDNPPDLNAALEKAVAVGKFVWPECHMKRKSGLFFSSTIEIRPFGKKERGLNGLCILLKKSQDGLIWDSLFPNHSDYLDHMATLLLDVDLKGTIVFCNRAVEKFSGLSRDRVIKGCLLESPWYPGGEEGKIRLFKAYQLARSGKNVIYDEWIKTHPGERVSINWNLIPVKSPLGMVTHILIEGQDITTQKQIEENFRQGQANLEQAQEMAQMGIWEWDIEKNAVTWSKELYFIYGVPQGNPTITFEGFLNFVHPGDREFVNQMVSQAFQNQQEFTFQHRILRPGGGVRTLMTRGRVLADKRGRSIKMLGTGQDISERRKMEEELRQSKELLDIVFQGVKEAICLLDGKGRFLMANREMTELLGYTQIKGVLDHSFLSNAFPSIEIFDEEGRPFPLDQLPIFQALEGAKSSKAIIRVRHLPSGRECWRMVKAWSLFNEEGKVRFCIVLFHDITQTKRSEQIFRFLDQAKTLLSEERDIIKALRKVGQVMVSQLAEIVVMEILEEDGHYIRVVSSQAGDSFLPEGEKDCPLGNREPLFPDPALQVFNGPIEEIPIALKKIPWVCERFKDDSFTSSSMIVPIVARERVLGAIFFFSGKTCPAFDDNDLKIMEGLGRWIGMTNENGRLLNRVQEAVGQRDEFISIAAHELKTPITSLKLLLQMAKRDLMPSPTGPALNRILEKIPKRLSMSLQQVEQLIKLIEDLLDVSRIQSGRMPFLKEEMDLGEVVREVIGWYEQELALAKCRVNLDIPLTVKGYWDRSRIEQILINLLSNSMKYAPGSTIQIGLRQDKKLASLVFQDNGPGMNEEVKAKVFERFERGPFGKNIPGLGLGLFITKKIVMNHNGTIHLEAQQGKGTTFRIELPLLPS